MSFRFSAAFGRSVLALAIFTPPSIAAAAAQGVPSAFAAARGEAGGIYIDAARARRRSPARPA